MLFLEVTLEPQQISNSIPHLSYIIIPDNSEGCLEHCMLAASPDSQTKQCAEEFVTCLDASVKNYNQRAKIQVRSMIAAYNPDMWFGDSANSSLWDWEQPSLSMILDFLERLNGLVKKSNQ